MGQWSTAKSSKIFNNCIPMIFTAQINWKKKCAFFPRAVESFLGDLVLVGVQRQNPSKIWNQWILHNCQNTSFAFSFDVFKILVSIPYLNFGIMHRQMQRSMHIYKPLVTERNHWTDTAAKLNHHWFIPNPSQRITPNL